MNMRIGQRPLPGGGEPTVADREDWNTEISSQRPGEGERERDKRDIHREERKIIDVYIYIYILCLRVSELSTFCPFRS